MTSPFEYLDFPGADDTERINNALGYIRTNGIYGATLRLGSGGIYLSDTINATHIDGLRIEADGGAGSLGLYATGFSQSKPILDLTGSSAFKIVSLVPGYQGVGAVPSVGFLIARSTTRSSNKGEMYGCGSIGRFAVSPLYVYGASNHAFYSCGFQQAQAGGCCAHLTHDNVGSVASPYQQIAAPGQGSTSDLLFVGCEFHTKNDATERTALSIRGVSNASFLGGVIDAYDERSSHVALTSALGLHCNSVAFRNVRFYKDQPGINAGTAILVNDIVDGLTVDTCSIQSGISSLIRGASGAVLNGPTIIGDLRSYGFTGKVIESAGSPIVTVKNGLIQACGLSVNAAIGSDTLVISRG